MSDLMLKVDNLSKCYRIGLAEKLSRSFRETVTDAVTAPFRNFWKLHQMTNFNHTENNDVIWALKDVSFEVHQGEVLGIIGKNGSGKSTLLKILSRITMPTSGMVEINGKISSLLEVGTGFHPELTGRENIFLNGAILGMNKKEIQSKFDAIVDFSEVGKYIDTPVKRYSSGMYVRLAFAVAAHLEPEILILDEVLAVGDVQFQKKSLAKMKNLAGSGRTVLFVSHAMASIKDLCQRTILLENGRIIENGPTDTVVKRYLGAVAGEEKVIGAEKTWPDVKTAPGHDVVRLKAVRVKNGKGEVTNKFNIQEPIYLEMELYVLQDGYDFDEFFRLYNEAEVFVLSTYNNLNPEWHNRQRSAGVYRGVCCIPANFLTEGKFTVWAAVVTLPTILQALDIDAVAFHVFDPGSGGARGDYTVKWPGGVIRPIFDWETEYLGK